MGALVTTRDRAVSIWELDYYYFFLFANFGRVSADDFDGPVP